MRIVDLLGDKLSEVEQLCKELRYYALYIDWGDGKPSHSGILADFHNFLHHMKEHYDWRREHLFLYMRDFEKHYFRKLKPEIIQLIENEIDPQIENAKCKTLYRKR